MTQLKNLIATFEQLWPVSGAESWDAPGLVSGNPDAVIKRVLLSVDVTNELVDEAAGEYGLLLSHHPFLMRGITLAGEDRAKGAVLAKAIRANLALFAAHTNADIVVDGVSAALAKAFGLEEAKPLVASANPGEGHGRVGKLQKATSLGEFARAIAKVLPATASGVRVAGDFKLPVQTVALCGGAGDSFISAAAESGADVYVTSDLRHHVVQEARETAQLAGGKPALVDISHWAAEWIWLEVAAEQLRKLHNDVEFVVSDLRTDPFDFVITQ